MSVPILKSDRILIVDDDPAMIPLVEALISGKAPSITAAATLGEGVRLAAQQRFDVIILDHLLPDGQGLDKVAELISQDRLRPILYITAQSGAHTAIEAIKRGAFDYLAKPLDFGLFRQRLLEALEYRHLTRLPVLVDGPDGAERSNDVLVGRCRLMQEVYKSIGRLAGLDAAVLIEGEVGTGKEMIARAIHQYGPRHQRPFLKIASEEFADMLHRRETYEHADRKELSLALMFPQCVGGTVLLEELGGLAGADQSKLLAALQSQATSAEPAIRLIVSTSLPSRELLHRGTLRSDLYYFVSPYSIRVPALRDREEDFELLVAHFMQRLARVAATNENQGPPRVSPAALALLCSHDWPGNVAQLKSVLQSVLMESRGAVLATDALNRALDSGGGEALAANTTLSSATSAASRAADPAGAAAWREAAPGSADCIDGCSPWDLSTFVRERLHAGTDHLYEDAVAQLERTLLTLVLQHTRGNQAQAAKYLGITRTSLRKKIAMARIDLPRLLETGVSADGDAGTERL